MNKKIGIKYPKDEKMKVYTKRLLIKNDCNPQRISLLATVNEQIISELQKLGNEIIMLESNNLKFIDKNNDFKLGFKEIYKLFERFVKAPKKFDFEKEIAFINLSIIDKAVEGLKIE